VNFDEARAAVYSRLKTFMDASHPAVKVEYENVQLIDRDQQLDAFVCCELLFTDGYQLALSGGVRYEGAIYLSHWAKEDRGTAASLQMLGQLATLFQMTSFGPGLNTRAPRPLPGRDQLGWHISTLRIPFWFDQL
jgi:hypothetical protein